MLYQYRSVFTCEARTARPEVARPELPLRLRLGKQDLAPHYLTLNSLLALQLLGARGTYEGHSQRVRDKFVPTFPQIPPFRPPSQPSPKGIPPWRHPAPSSTPPIAHPGGCFTTSLDITKCPLLPSPVRRFFPVSLHAHPHTRMFQIKRKLHMAKTFLLIVTIVPNKSPMLPPSTTPTVLHPPSMDRVSATTV